MWGRTAEAAIFYNGKAVTTALYPFFLNMTYTDPAEGESDSLSLTLGDKDGLWSNAWTPRKGDVLQTFIRVYEWNGVKDERELACGQFILDEIRFSGWESKVELEGLSMPTDSAFQCEERSRTWERIAISKIVGDIAGRAGLRLLYDAPEIILQELTQRDQTDSAFLQSLCEDYGLSMKIYGGKLVLFDREVYKARDAAATIPAEDLLSYQYRTTTLGSYTGCRMTYTDPKSEQEVTYETGTGPRLLKLTGRAENRADAERKGKAALLRENHAVTTLEIKTIGNPSLVASQTVQVVGLGNLSGKYYIDQAIHTLGGGGYTTVYRMSLVEARGAAAVLDAIARLAAVGVINTPDYWNAHYGEVRFLDELLLNLSVRIREKRAGGNVATVDKALTVLTEKGVLNSPDYWQKHYTALAYIGDLLIQAANALEGDMG